MPSGEIVDTKAMGRGTTQLTSIAYEDEIVEGSRVRYSDAEVESLVVLSLTTTKGCWLFIAGVQRGCGDDSRRLEGSFEI